MTKRTSCTNQSIPDGAGASLLALIQETFKIYRVPITKVVDLGADSASMVASGLNGGNEALKPLLCFYGVCHRGTDWTWQSVRHVKRLKSWKLLVPLQALCIVFLFSSLQNGWRNLETLHTSLIQIIWNSDHFMRTVSGWVSVFWPCFVIERYLGRGGWFDCNWSCQTANQLQIFQPDTSLCWCLGLHKSLEPPTCFGAEILGFSVNNRFLHWTLGRNDYYL